MSLPSIMWLKGASGTAPSHTLTFDASTVGTANNTFSASMSIGVADATRLVVVTVSFPESVGSVSSLTVGGITATHVVNAGAVAIYQVVVTTGTSATVVVNLSAAAGSILVSTYSLYNLSSNTAFSTATSTTSLSTAISTPNGFLIAIGGDIQNFSCPPANIYTGVNVTVDNTTTLLNCTCNGNFVSGTGHATVTSGSGTFGFNDGGIVSTKSLVIATWN